MRGRSLSRSVVGAFPVASAGIISGLAFLISGAAWRTLLRTGNPALGFVVAGFAVMGAKSLAKAALLLRGGVDAPWEFAFTLADVATVSLIAWPILARRGSAP